MEIFTKERWEEYKKYVKDFNREAINDIPPGTMCGYLKKPTFVGYMDFVFEVENES